MKEGVAQLCLVSCIYNVIHDMCVCVSFKSFYASFAGKHAFYSKLNHWHACHLTQTYARVYADECHKITRKQLFT